MNYRFFAIILPIPLLSYGFVSVTSLFNLASIGQIYEKKVTALKEECDDKKQCECCTALLEKSFKWDEINAFSKLSSEEQEKMINILLMAAKKKCKEENVLDGFTQEDCKILQKYEDVLWEKKRRDASVVEEIIHTAIRDVLEEKKDSI